MALTWSELDAGATLCPAGEHRGAERPQAPLPSGVDLSRSQEVRAPAT